MKIRLLSNWWHKVLPLLVLLMGACASAPPLPRHEADLGLPRRAHIIEHTAGQPDLDSMLVVQQEGQASRWSLFDPLGVPLARQLLQNGKWSSDGLLPPNAQARALFAKLVFAWMPQDQLDSAYGPGAWRARTLPDGGRERVLLNDGTPTWTVQWPAPPVAQDTFMIKQADGKSWLVAPLEEQQ